MAAGIPQGLVAALLALVVLAVPADAARLGSMQDAARGYSVGFMLCTTHTWTDGTVTETCRMTKWCKGTLLEPRKCVHAAPWTLVTRTYPR